MEGPRRSHFAPTVKPTTARRGISGPRPCYAAGVSAFDWRAFLEAVWSSWWHLMTSAAGVAMTVIGIRRGRETSGKIFLGVGLFFLLVALGGIWSDEHNLRTALEHRLDGRDFAIRKAGEYGPLVQEGWKRQVEWIEGQKRPTAPQEAEGWRTRVRQRLDDDFGVDAANRFNIGAAQFPASPLFDHIRRVQELSLIVQEIRRGDLRPLSKPRQ